MMPDRFEICGAVSRTKDTRDAIEKEWGIKTYASMDLLLRKHKPDFIVVAVNKDHAHSVIAEISQIGIPLLAETPPANDLQSLITLNKAIHNNKTRIQIAEQYYFQPAHASRITLAQSGIIGTINHVQVSIGHGYHGISLIRKILGISYDNAIISAVKHFVPVIDGPSRNGWPQKEHVVNKEQIVASLEFCDKTALFDFEKDQHRSPVRSSRILIRGERGEICNDTVRYMKEYPWTLTFDITRNNAGENENPQGHYLIGITAGEKYLYVNKFAPACMSDDEIAVASVLEKMAHYVRSDVSFYSLAEASQDCYLAIMIEKAIQEKRQIGTEHQIWAKETIF